jgi:hypothetical protein
MNKSYKTIIYKPNGVCLSKPFKLLREAKKYARKEGYTGDKIAIQEHTGEEQVTLYDYVMEDWSITK